MTNKTKKILAGVAGLLFILSAVGLMLSLLAPGNVQTISQVELRELISDKNVKSISYKLKGGENYEWYTVIATTIEEVEIDKNKYSSFEVSLVSNAAMQELITFAEEYQVATIKAVPITADWIDILGQVLPWILAAVLFIIFIRALSNAGAAGDKRGENIINPKVQMNKNKTTLFKDVAGCDEEKVELAEIIDFLKNPKKYQDMGAKIPKGVLLVGSPGTGKTLLAKAVAGEADVPFFSISGSDFVELYVGVGASRVRKLFSMALREAPCILFIDEIDAVGRQRGAGLGGGNDEREQTLNQLLVEMDGFNPNIGIIIIAATNRPDILDKALLRPGRFDRQITIPLPDLKGREEILKVHAQNKKISPSLSFKELAARLPGFSGADIANLLNEAALLAARENRKVIVEKDVDEATDRVLMGPAKKSRKYTDYDKKLVSYHEAGHAVIGLKLSDAKIVQKITIIPRGTAGGYNLMTDKHERMVVTKNELIAEITSYLGGRVAEELVFNTYTTGAYGDFSSATKIARAMVTEYGMSDLGPIQYESGSGDDVFLGRDYMKNKDFSDNVASAIDNEVRKIILSSYETAKKVISENRELLDTIANYLVEIETITRADIEEISLTGKIAWWEKEKVEAAEAKIKKEQEDLKKKEEKPAEPETKIEEENKGDNQ